MKIVLSYTWRNFSGQKGYPFPVYWHILMTAYFIYKKIWATHYYLMPSSKEELPEFTMEQNKIFYTKLSLYSQFYKWKERIWTFLIVIPNPN